MAYGVCTREIHLYFPNVLSTTTNVVEHMQAALSEVFERSVNARVNLGWVKFGLAIAAFLLVAETLPASKKSLRSKSPRWALTVPYITRALGYVGTCVDFWMMTCLVRKSPSVENFIAGLAGVLAPCVIAQDNLLDETRLESERDRSVLEYILDATYRDRLVWIEPTVPDSTGETAEGPQNVISK
ncbi:hypothetical protein TI39_contig462g00011 [Zymoseptoria brevis]|uniref:Uncharacterized protein n=1 Tax=Zymoseptoria brevis TaxID=1047168 RepID=A0A0F4GK37_9PEZI|nr:hypothetical protein TI39_contig462g00011 [Zymoseptoria brevis]